MIANFFLLEAEPPERRLRRLCTFSENNFPVHPYRECNENDIEDSEKTAKEKNKIELKVEQLYQCIRNRVFNECTSA